MTTSTRRIASSLVRVLVLLACFVRPGLAQQRTSSQVTPAAGATVAPETTLTATAAAQEKPAAPPPPQLLVDEDGFQLRSADRAFSLRLRGEVQTDGRFFVDDEAEAGANTFYLRRVRTTFQGTLYRSFDFVLRADFGQGATQILDSYLNARLTPAFGLQGGKFKAPVSLERLQSAADRTLIELSFPVGLLPNRDVGVQVQGELLGQRLEYQLGVFNGVADGGSGDADSYDSKDVAARLFAQPFRTSRVKALQGLGLGFAATVGTQHGSLAAANVPTYRTSARQTFFRFRTGADLAATTIADGERTRLVPQAYYYAGPFGLTTEYARNIQSVRRGESTAELVAEAAHVTASVLLTGEKATYRRLKPRKPFDSGKGQWGAFEVAGRVQTLRLGDAAFPVYANPAQAVQSALGWTVGLNWYLNANVRFALNYERTTFTAADGGAALAPENLLMTRLQLAF